MVDSLDTSPASLRQRLGPLLLIVGLFFFNVFGRSIFSPILLDIEREFGISHTVSSRFFLMITLGYAVSIVCSGFISSRIMHRRTIALSSMLIGCSMIIIGFAPVLPLVHGGLLLMGAGAGLYPPSGLTVITDMIERKDWQKALAVHELGPHVAMMAVPLYAAAVLTLSTWRMVMVSSGILACITALVFLLRVKVGNTPGEPPTLSNMGILFKIPSFWIMMLLFGLALSSIQGIYLLIPTFMVTEGGFTQQQAHTIFGISRFLPIAALLTAGFVLDRFGVKRTIFSVIFIAGITIALLGILQGPWLALMIFLQPAVGALFFPAGVSAVSLIGPPRTRNVAFSMLLPFASFLGTGGIPAFIGYMGDHVSFAAGFLVVGIVTSLCAVLTCMLNIKE